MNEEKLVEIRCPLVVQMKNGREYTCNRLCHYATPGSGGKAYCRSHKTWFEFSVEADNQSPSLASLKAIPSSKIDPIAPKA